MGKKIEGIDDEYQELGSRLKNIDFSQETNAKEIYKQTLKNIKIEEGKNMLRNKIKALSIAAASFLVISIAIVKPTWAVDGAKFFLNKITFGQGDFYEVSHDKQPLPDYAQGKVFDKDGNPVTEEDPYNRPKLYDADGKEIFEIKDSKIITIDEKDNYVLETQNADEINDYINFKVKMPEYLPEGFEFEKANFEKYHEDDPMGSLQATGITFKSKSNNQEISISEFNTGDKPVSVMGKSNMKTVKVNGEDAVEYEDGSIQWTKDEILYGIKGSNLDENTAVKIAESIK